MSSCRASAACSPHRFRGADLQSAHATGWSALLDLYLCGFWNSWMMPLLHILSRVQTDMCTWVRQVRFDFCGFDLTSGGEKLVRRGASFLISCHPLRALVFYPLPFLCVNKPARFCWQDQSYIEQRNSSCVSLQVFVATCFTGASSDIKSINSSRFHFTWASARHQHLIDLTVSSDSVTLNSEDKWLKLLHCNLHYRIITVAFNVVWECAIIQYRIIRNSIMCISV